MKKVYLVGAGPGDPGLLTLKGRDALAAADVVLYDNLANPELLHYAPPTAEHIYVGKKKSHHTLTQDEICALLVEKGSQGKCVVRLKGGDPFIFSRDGEEAEALADAGTPSKSSSESPPHSASPPIAESPSLTASTPPPSPSSPATTSNPSIGTASATSKPSSSSWGSPMSAKSPPD